MAGDTPSFQHRLVRQVLLAPAIVRKAAATRARTREERWLLDQPKHVRESYVREVLDHGDGDPRLQEMWMLRQSNPVRASYVREVLEPNMAERPRPAP